jgi:hypothetical protein
VSTRANHQAGFDRIVNPPAVSGPFNRFHLFTQSQLGATTLQEVIIKFASTDSKAYHVLVANSDFFATKHAELETGNRLKNASPGVFLHIDLERLDDFRGYPTSASLVSRKTPLVHDDDVQS